MSRISAVSLGLAVWLLAAPAPVCAQSGAGSIAGTVRDASGAVLPGVTVEASSPAQIERVRTVVTDGEGQYKLIELRPGTYVVSFSLTGFSSARREGIELTTGFTAAINASLKVGSVEETITVTGESPVVDIQNTRQQVVMTRDVVDAVPSGKMYTNLAVLIPGITATGAVGSVVAQDVGGQNGQSYVAMQIHGSRQADQQLQVDGLSMVSWSRVDSSAIMFVDGNFQEYAIDTSANSAETEAGGVRINMIPRDGSNEFKGSFFANFSDHGLQADNLTSEISNLGLRDVNRLKRVWQANPTVGGPIRKNRLWAFASYTRLRADQYVAGAYLNKNPAAWVYTPDLSKQSVDDQWADDEATRVTYQATARNKFTFYYEHNFNCHCHFTIGKGTASEASRLANHYSHIYQVGWVSPLTNRLLVETVASAAPQEENWDPQPEAVAPTIVDAGINLMFRASTPQFIYTTNPGLRGSLSYVTGSHALKVGFTLLGGTYKSRTERINNVTYATLNGVPTQVTYWGDPVTALNSVRPNLGMYVQDQWTVKRLSVNGGLRMDYFRSLYPAQTVPVTQYVLSSRAFPALDATNWKDLSPRAGAAYDLRGDGKTALKVSVNRYVLQQGVNFSTAINPINGNNSNARRWTDANGDYVVQGDPYNNAANGELGPSGNVNFGRPAITARLDPKWATGFAKRPYQWEFSAGVQREIMPRVSAGAAFFHRTYGNFSVIENQAVSPSDYSSYCVTTPNDSRLPGAGQQLCGLRDLNPNKVGQVSNMTTSAGNYGEASERWNGMDLTVNARLSKVLLQGGMSTGKTIANNCDIATKYPNVVLAAPAGSPTLASGPSTSTALCHVEEPFLTQVKLLGSYTLPYDIRVAATYQNIPGPQILATGTFTSAQIAPSLGRPLGATATATVNMIAPGTLYGDRMSQIDFRFTKTFRIGRARVQGMLDLFNALNANTVLVLSNAYGATTGAATGSAWQVPQGILPGRIVKVGTQINF